MSSYWVMGIMAAAQPRAQPTGVPYLTIFGVAGTAIGILAAVQQFSSSIRRRRFQGAEEEFMRAVQSSKVISESLSQMEQYQKTKDILRNEIETQIPKQARIAYLSNRIEQVQDDLRRSYLEYENIKKELSRNQEVSELDQSVRDVVAATMPARRLQESRTFYMLFILYEFNGDYSWVNYAGTSFYVSTVALSLGIAIPITLWQRGAWGRGEGAFRQRKAAG